MPSPTTHHSPFNTNYMRHALALARAQLGQVWPNPAVGCVIVKDHSIIGEGATARGGRPHAETVALNAAGDKSRGATLYVTLEPCAHHGQTPPCVEAIIAAGIVRVVVACHDPNPTAAGGIKQLRAAGIEVIEDICANEAVEINRGFFSLIQERRPYIAMKIATSVDDKIARAAGTKTAITGPAARDHSHYLRAEFDAILTGIGTVLADDPLLTVRIPGLEHRSPVRVVLDSHGRLPPDSKLMQTAHQVPVWIIHSPSLRGKAEAIQLDRRATYVARDDETIESIVKLLTRKGITRLLIEAGQAVNTSFLTARLVDRLYWYQSPERLGESALNAVKDTRLADLLNDWQPVGDVLTIGTDTLTIYEKDGSPFARG